ncbi:unnamed protein product [Rangifer tarandus platyrhynchus]|uniref:Uncharacterized protein n=1 Tax=Rangifer tarandus platyrhynchus TaxID=3082113 RepID=A0ABN9A4H9_RANTA|nr:unnamed protein product [Rangifer tarandus platyrhynchus]
MEVTEKRMGLECVLMLYVSRFVDGFLQPLQRVSFSLTERVRSLSMAEETFCAMAPSLLSPPLWPCWPPHLSVNRLGVIPPFVLDVPPDIRQAGIDMLPLP